MIIDFLLALAVALLLTAVFAGGFRRPGPWAGVFWFFVIVFLAAWAGGVWLLPFGPHLWGVPWLAFVIVGLLVALLLAAATPVQPPRTPQELREAKEAEAAASAVAAVTLSIFFWVLLLLLIVSLVLHYTAEPAV